MTSRRQERRQQIYSPSWLKDEADLPPNQRFAEPSARITAIRVGLTGCRGFLGIGRRPNQYDVDVLHPAVVEVTYKVKARISIEFGEPTSWQPMAKESTGRWAGEYKCAFCGHPVSMAFIGIPSMEEPINFRCGNCHRRCKIKFIADGTLQWRR